MSLSPIVITKSADKVVCVQLDVHIWSGRRVLKRDDFVAANSSFTALPESEFTNHGTVKVVNPDEIKHFHKIKARAERMLRKAGLPLLGSWAIPETKFEVVCDELTTLKREFESARQSLVDNYNARIAAWRSAQIAKYPSWAHVLTNLPTADTVEHRTGFAFHAYRIDKPSSIESAVGNKHFDEQLGGLKGELLAEVRKEAHAVAAEYLYTSEGKKRDSVTMKTLGPLRRAAAKLESFAFLDPTVGPLGAFIKKQLAQIHVEGEKIQGEQLLALSVLAHALSDTRRLAETAGFIHAQQEAQALEFARQSYIGGNVVDTSVLNLVQIDGPAAQSGTPASVLQAADFDLAGML
jgi:Protein of unknown function (DUF3150)